MASADDAKFLAFIIEWWREFLTGCILFATALLLKSKGKDNTAVVIPLSESEIERRMTICKQSILLTMNTALDERDKKLFNYISSQDEKMLQHIKDIINK